MSLFSKNSQSSNDSGTDIDGNDLFSLTNSNINIEKINKSMIETSVLNKNDNSWSDLDESILMKDALNCQNAGENFLIKSETICCNQEVSFVIFLLTNLNISANFFSRVLVVYRVNCRMKIRT